MTLRRIQFRNNVDLSFLANFLLYGEETKNEDLQKVGKALWDNHLKKGNINNDQGKKENKNQTNSNGQSFQNKTD